MINRKFIKKLDKSIGISRIKTQIQTINIMLVFLVVAAAYAIYLNHTGIMLSYGIIVAAVAMIILALFLSYRIKQQVKLNGMHLDYRKMIVQPVVQTLYENGSFSRKGSLTEREILMTNMFSDTYEYKYESKNEIKGRYKDVDFESSDIRETKDNTNMSIPGRVFQFAIPTGNINPVVFISASAQTLERNDERVHLCKTGDPELDKRFRTYAFDEKEVQGMINSSMEFKLMTIIKMGLGRIVRLCFCNDKVCVYYSTEGSTFQEDLTKKEQTPAEVKRVEEELSVIDKLIDVLK